MSSGEPHLIAKHLRSLGIKAKANDVNARLLINPKTGERKGVWTVTRKKVGADYHGTFDARAKGTYNLLTLVDITVAPGKPKISRAPRASTAKAKAKASRQQGVGITAAEPGPKETGAPVPILLTRDPAGRAYGAPAGSHGDLLNALGGGGPGYGSYVPPSYSASGRNGYRSLP